MTQKHKYYDLILAWANGETIQCLAPADYSEDCWGKKTKWVDITTPSWDVNQTYRIKPVDPVFAVRNLTVSQSGDNYYSIQIDFYADSNSANEFIDSIRNKMY